MADFERGYTFLDKKAINIQGEKGKYFIALTNANYEDDEVVCFVMNTEKKYEQHHQHCNKRKGKFIIKPNTFTFIDRYTSIMLNKEAYYTLSELLANNIILKDLATEELQRQIKNCIDFGYLLPKAKELIKEAFK